MHVYVKPAIDAGCGSVYFFIHLFILMVLDSEQNRSCWEAIYQLMGSQCCSFSFSGW